MKNVTYFIDKGVVNDGIVADDGMNNLIAVKTLKLNMFFTIILKQNKFNNTFIKA